MDESMKRERSRTLQAHRTTLNGWREIAGVFGSVARDEAREDSDVDVLVELPPPRLSPSIWI